jgi:hypothetical protein
MSLLFVLQQEFLQKIVNIFTIIKTNLKLIIVIIDYNVLMMSKKMYDSICGPRAPTSLLGVAMVTYHASFFAT